MSPYAGAGLEAHEPKRFGSRRVERSPDVDAEVGCEDRKFVDQSDVHVAEGVLDELRKLRFSRAGHRHSRLYQGAVEVLDCLQRSFPDAGDDFRGVREAKAAVAWVDSFGAVPEVVVLASAQAS